MSQDHPAYRLAAIPEPPESLSDGAKQEWRILAPIVTEISTGRGADLRALALLCELLADIRSLEAAVRRDGFTIEAGSGGKKAHPALSSLAAARRQAEQLLGKFGLLPTGHRAPKYSEGQHHHIYGVNP